MLSQIKRFQKDLNNILPIKRLETPLKIYLKGQVSQLDNKLTFYLVSKSILYKTQKKLDYNSGVFLYYDASLKNEG